MRAIAMGAFLTSAAVTGAATTATLIWTVTATLGFIGIGGWVVMALTARQVFRRPTNLDEAMSRNQYRLSRDRPQPPSRNGRRRTSAMRYSRRLNLREVPR